MDTSLIVSPQNFPDRVIVRSFKCPVVVIFYSDHSIFDGVTDKQIVEVYNQHIDKIDLVLVYTKPNDSVSNVYDISGTPTVSIFVDGEKVHQYPTHMLKSKLLSSLNDAVKVLLEDDVSQNDSSKLRTSVPKPSGRPNPKPIKKVSSKIKQDPQLDTKSSPSQPRTSFTLDLSALGFGIPLFIVHTYVIIGSIVASISIGSQITYYSWWGPGWELPYGALVLSAAFGMFTSILRGLLWPIMSYPVWYGDMPLSHWLFFPWFGSL